MATVVLATAGKVIGGAIGGPIGAAIGGAIGSAIGGAVDNRIISALDPGVTREGPRLESLDLTTSNEGAPVPDLVGRAAISGEIIWAARLKEVVTRSKEKVGSGKNKQKVETVNYDYFASFAVALAEGPIARIGRIWIDNELFDYSDNPGLVRFYPGSESQLPDPTIEAVEGWAPAYRGTAYVVFTELPVAAYGNRIPQVKIECWGRSGEMERLIRGVNIIPGSTEWGYSPEIVETVEYSGGVLGAFTNGKHVKSSKPENAIRGSGLSDWQESMRDLRALLPNAKTASLVVAWFGDDLRAGRCQIAPRVENKSKNTLPEWSAAGLSRRDAVQVSAKEGRPAFGSSPADASVIAAIRDLRSKGRRSVLYPFVMMDITAAQALPDTSGEGVQGAYPWRGRIMPAHDETAAQAVARFMGTARPGDFTVSDGRVVYSGPVEWSYRRFILHLAHLAKAAGGVDAFLIGSEMRGMTMASDTPGAYPFVDALRDLAADVRAVLPGAKISYAADWSEYHSDRRAGRVLFHLDSLWADKNIDFIGIDNYLPLSDWRPGRDHLDYDPAKGHLSGYDLDYLKSQIEGGEYWDYYYADEAARIAQERTPIEDFHGEPWIYRQKAIRDWWSNPHRNRPDGKPGVATAWQPKSKPVWFTEIGCPAVDSGATRPNVFWAYGSSESALPWGSDGLRDDYMQRQFLRAALEYWRDHGGAMVQPDNIQVWAWDARPWPEFPRATGQWSDGRDWRLGHWLNGRAGAACASDAIRSRLARHGHHAVRLDLTHCHGQVDGYPATGQLGFRDWLAPLQIGLGLQAHEAGGRLTIESRAALPVMPTLDESDLVTDGAAPSVVAARSAIEDVAQSAIVHFRDGGRDYVRAAAQARIGPDGVEGNASADLPLIVDYDIAQTAAENLLRAASATRESISFTAPRSAVDLRPGAIVPLVLGDRPARLYVVDRVTDGMARQIEAREWSDSSLKGAAPVRSPARRVPVRGSSFVQLRVLDLPLLPGFAVQPWDSWLAVHAQPWPGLVAVAQSASAEGGFERPALAEVLSKLGALTAPLAPARPFIWTEGPLEVELLAGLLVGRDATDILAGENALAVQHPDGWEILQFREAALTGKGRYRLTGLLRGQRGTDHLAARPIGAGAAVVVLDSSLTPLGLTETDAARDVWLRFGPVSKPVTDHALRRHSPARAGLRPFAPVHLRPRWPGGVGGNMVLDWQARSRNPVATFPARGSAARLSEMSGQYRVEIGLEANPLRVVTVNAPRFTYSPEMRAADGIRAPYRVAVSQISATYGPGPAAVVTIQE